MTCLEPGREGMGITFGKRDALGLTFSIVIMAQAREPKIEERGKENWPIALCGYGKTHALRHRVQLLCVASLLHLGCAHRLGSPLAGLSWRVRVGLAPGPPLKFKLRRFSGSGGFREYLFPYQPKPTQRRDSQATPSLLPFRWVWHRGWRLNGAHDGSPRGG
jgi:hypothetical protein